MRYGIGMVLAAIALAIALSACGGTLAPSATVTATPAATPSATPTAPAASTRAIPFVVCESSKAWVRPTEEEHLREILSRPRYVGGDRERLVEIFSETSFRWHGGNSELFDSAPLHGLYRHSLWPMNDAQRNEECESFGPNRLYRGEAVWLYLLLYEAQGVEVQGETLLVTVKRTQTGYQSIAFDNVLFPEGEGFGDPKAGKKPFTAYRVVVVDETGEHEVK